MDSIMLEKLKRREALSVRNEGTEVRDGLFELKRFIDGKEYCDPTKGRWITSVGRSVWTGKIMASTDAMFYQDPNYDCLLFR